MKGREVQGEWVWSGRQSHTGCEPLKDTVILVTSSWWLRTPSGRKQGPGQAPSPDPEVLVLLSIRHMQSHHTLFSLPRPTAQTPAPPPSPILQASLCSLFPAPQAGTRLPGSKADGTAPSPRAGVCPQGEKRSPAWQPLALGVGPVF